MPVIRRHGGRQDTVSAAACHQIIDDAV